MDKPLAGGGRDDKAARDTEVMESAEEMRGRTIEQRDADVDGITRTARFQRARDPQAREAVELFQQRLQGPAAIKSGKRASRLGAYDDDAITSMPRPERCASGGS
jgi:hypothetical protein